MANVSLVLDHHLFLMAHRFEAPENPGTTIYAGTANTDSTGATDNRGYGIGGNRDAPSTKPDYRILTFASRFPPKQYLWSSVEPALSVFALPDLIVGK